MGINLDTETRANLNNKITRDLKRGADAKADLEAKLPGIAADLGLAFEEGQDGRWRLGTKNGGTFTPLSEKGHHSLFRKLVYDASGGSGGKVKKPAATKNREELEDLLLEAIADG
ncbi:hypothetical protein ACFWFQ_17435, partial [Nocardia salmonicida]|uniref:hypothetical protein n=1 Tax=Nocardia salmonicida TaxID=53431 RepID=UPI003664922D